MLFPSFISQNSGEILIFITFSAKFSKIFNFGLYFTENRQFWARPWLWRHCDVILGMLVFILKEKTPSYTMVLITCIWGCFIFKFTRGVVTTPLVNSVTKKKSGGLVGRGLILWNFRMISNVRLFQNLGKEDTLHYRKPCVNIILLNMLNVSCLDKDKVIPWVYQAMIVYYWTSLKLNNTTGRLIDTSSKFLIILNICIFNLFVF